jgi:hypothetical protein
MNMPCPESFSTYKEYRDSRSAAGLNVLPESLYNALKANPLPASEK